MDRVFKNIVKALPLGRNGIRSIRAYFYSLDIYIVSICQSTTSNKSTGTKKMGKGEGGLGVREKVIDRSIRIIGSLTSGHSSPRRGFFLSNPFFLPASTKLKFPFF